MVDLSYITGVVYPAVFSMLPKNMDSPQARTMMTAIGRQESRFKYRQQTGGGPAHGFWQFERGGVHGVLSHVASQGHAIRVLKLMGYDTTIEASYPALINNDVLAGVFARLLLWTHHAPLPTIGEYDRAWDYYNSLWRPGKPHRETWNAFLDEAWK